MLEAVLIDSEIPSLNDISYLLSENYVEILGAFTDSDQALDFIVTNKPDVVFLDIDMPQSNGIGLALLIQNVYPDVSLVFVSGHSTYALEAYKAYPVDFLLKPIDGERLSQTITHLEKTKLQRPKGIAADLKIKCFGKFEVLAGTTPIKFPTHKTMMLLAYLICKSDDVIYRDELIEAILDQKSSEKNINNLRVTLYRLRNTLAKASIKENSLLIKENYSIQIEDSVCDYIDFLRFVKNYQSVEKGNLTRATRVADSLCGEFLSNIDALWISEKKEWLDIQIEKLMINIAAYFISIKQMEKAETYLLKLIEINPMSEYGYLMLLDLYISTENMPKYNIFYRYYVKLMTEELDQSPDQFYTDYFKKHNQGMQNSRVIYNPKIAYEKPLKMHEIK